MVRVRARAGAGVRVRVRVKVRVRVRVRVRFAGLRAAHLAQQLPGPPRPHQARAEEANDEESVPDGLVVQADEDHPRGGARVEAEGDEDAEDLVRVRNRFRGRVSRKGCG